MSVRNLFLELLIYRRYAARHRVKALWMKEPGDRTQGGFTIRPRQSATLRGLAKRGEHLKARRSTTNTISRRSSVMVTGGFTSGKRLVSEPVRPHSSQQQTPKAEAKGKPTYKPTVKSEATREDSEPSGQDASSTAIKVPPMKRQPASSAG